jgi:hypothetical protein
MFSDHRNHTVHTYYFSKNFPLNSLFVWWTFCSRFDSIICFDLPDQQTRMEIASQYAKHLSKSELAQLSLATEK